MKLKHNEIENVWPISWAIVSHEVIDIPDA